MSDRFTDDELTVYTLLGASIIVGAVALVVGAVVRWLWR